MDISEAYKVLEEFFSEEELEKKYRDQKFDRTGYDSDKKLEYNATLLKNIALSVKDKNKYEKLINAANVFEEKYKFSRYE